MYKMSPIDKFSIIMMILGGINWGIIGLFQLNLINLLLNSLPLLEKIIYILVGLSSLNVLVLLFKCKSKEL
ncbi:hypothetical protein CLHOM_04830 [Clostridium homopropionicum DSM 5847]|uniref:DUF378 domain-containing protein n=1 Tax=Clostridium homopropionicum DSM 5847 TaxID=1121318 RepID=A0A0L6ZD46_9CLOT|nr:DUF378 domain-containing protein [Clostridium homopropionicum]KOA20895.1 hypothetical protein CLHOM_04830 [Clostridium homopropionicum DSM 5847]SFG02698.1 Uncharacterized membrane protein YuzA, DUF378 family [Clostridium homopropionicum]